MIKVTADFLIDRRKRIWNKYQDIKRDEKFVQAVCFEIISNKNLRQEILDYPEKLIELTFNVVDKNKKLVPFFLNNVQHSFIEILNKAIQDYKDGLITNISILILKGRQQGFTTLITAIQLARTITRHNFEGLTLADKSTNTEAIFQNKAKFVYNRLPECIKPTEKYNSKKQLLFEKLNSSWAVETATKEVGRSRTINFFHGSECAFWKDGIANIQASLGEAFTKDSIKIYETTANGFNDYRTMWRSGEHINCFYEWWLTPEYRLNFETKNRRTKFLNDIYRVNDWIHQRLKWLLEEKGLDENQLYWYYKKYNGYIDKELIKQEYPCTPEEAFIASGKCYFDKDIIIKYIDRLEGKKDYGVIKRGYFKYEIKYDEKKHKQYIDGIAWVDDPTGPIKIFEEPDFLRPYVLGGDTAGEGSDKNTATVIDNITEKVVATLEQEKDETSYTIQVYCLGMYYNKALVGLETNFSTYPTKMLSEVYEYPNLYVREKEDDYTGKLYKSYGFETNKKTRPIILANLQRIMNQETSKITDIEILREGIVFIKNEKGRPEAQQGCHDDRIMGTAITYYIADQQVKVKQEPLKQKEVYMKEESFDKDFYSDFDDDEITPI